MSTKHNTTIDDSTVMPTTRTDNWDEYVPNSANEYIPGGTELAEIEALLDARHETDSPVRVLLGGPTGAGKTSLAEHLAHERGLPLFTIQASYSMHEADLLGSPQLIDGDSVWVDGVVVQALRCSAERPCILLIDEVNRARPEAKSALFSALDHRAQVELPLRGHETIQGDPTNLITISTINEGAGYFTQEMDRAEKRRLGSKWDVDYLSVDDEAVLITGRTDVGEQLARLMAKAATDIRDRARDDDSPVKMGLPTSAVLEWASMAETYAAADFENPVVKAAQPSVVDPFYDGDAADTVRSLITSRVDGAPVDDDEVEQWVGGGSGSNRDGPDIQTGPLGEYTTQDLDTASVQLRMSGETLDIGIEDFSIGENEAEGPVSRLSSAYHDAPTVPVAPCPSCGSQLTAEDLYTGSNGALCSKCCDVELW